MMRRYALFDVILTLVRRPKAYSVRELAAAAKVSPSTAKEVLDQLYDLQILRRTVVGKTYQYELNLNNFLTRQIKVLINLYEIAKSGLVNELLKNKGIISIVLYGSAAKGIDDPKSDFDILVIADKKIKITGLRSLRKLSREVSISVYSMREWRAKAKRDPVFYESVITSCIPLYGEVPVV